MLALWHALPWPDRQCVIRVGGAGVTLQRRGMHVDAWSADGGLVEIIYEHALHEQTRVRVTPAVAVQLVRAVLGRERLCRVAVPEAEPRSVSE
jgi:hypothetical protein